MLVFVICGFIKNFLPNSYFILQIYHAKSFKMRHVSFLYLGSYIRYSRVQIQKWFILIILVLTNRPRRTWKITFIIVPIYILINSLLFCWNHCNVLKWMTKHVLMQKLYKNCPNPEKCNLCIGCLVLFISFCHMA